MGFTSPIIGLSFCLSTLVVVFKDEPDDRARVLLVASDQMLQEFINNVPLDAGHSGNPAFLFGDCVWELSWSVIEVSYLTTTVRDIYADTN